MSGNHEDVAIIKKYSNRRLYNTQTSCYITLDDLFDIIKRGEDFKVLDAKTNEDLTRSVLTQVIFEREAKGYNLLPVSFLKNLITLYDNDASKMFSNYLEVTMDNFVKNRNYFENGIEEFNPVRIFEQITKQNIDMMNKTMGIFSHDDKEES